jgi:hypothetical protein
VVYKAIITINLRKKLRSGWPPDDLRQKINFRLV